MIKKYLIIYKDISILNIKLKGEKCIIMNNNKTLNKSFCITALIIVLLIGVYIFVNPDVYKRQPLLKLCMKRWDMAFQLIIILWITQHLVKNKKMESLIKMDPLSSTLEKNGS